MVAGDDRRAVTVAAPSTRPSWWAWLLAAAAIFALSLISVNMTPPGGSVAVWWPAAGVAALFILRVPRTQWWAVLVMVAVVTVAANVLGGRDVPIAGAFGVCNAMEVGIFARFSSGAGRGSFGFDR